MGNYWAGAHRCARPAGYSRPQRSHCGTSRATSDEIATDDGFVGTFALQPIPRDIRVISLNARSIDLLWEIAKAGFKATTRLRDLACGASRS